MSVVKIGAVKAMLYLGAYIHEFFFCTFHSYCDIWYKRYASNCVCICEFPQTRLREVLTFPTGLNASKGWLGDVCVLRHGLPPFVMFVSANKSSCGCTS